MSIRRYKSMLYGSAASIKKALYDSLLTKSIIQSLSF